MRISMHHARGFSMIELAIALTLVGIFMASSMATYNIYAKQREVSTTAARATPVRVALQKFFALNGRFPCPASPQANETSAAAGVENCLAGFAAGNCSGWICRVNGNGDTVLIGSVPYTTLGIVPKETYDAWGAKLGYAVTDSLTSSASYNANFGAIDVVDPQGNPPDTLTPAGRYKFIVWSFGSSKRGAYTPQGKQIAACTGQGRDIENCDNTDATFLTDTFTDAGGVRQSIRALVPGANFYDSYVLLYKIYLNTDFWTAVASTPDTMTNSFSGRVGIGVTDPQQALEVGGAVAADRLRSTEYCLDDGSKCFKAELIGGTDTSCHGESMIGIRDGAAACVGANVSVVTGSLPVQSCPAGKYVIGIDPSGDFVCADPPP